LTPWHFGQGQGFGTPPHDRRRDVCPVTCLIIRIAVCLNSRDIWTGRPKACIALAAPMTLTQPYNWVELAPIPWKNNKTGIGALTRMCLSIQINYKSQISFTLLGWFGVGVLFITRAIARITWGAMTGPTGKCPASRRGCSLTVSRALEIAKVAK
jgi:hypothetical protein